jgi:GntR family transcriptional regulator of gluconate operon
VRPLDTRRLLAEDAADRIREEILCGRFSQGQRLVEASIAEQLGTSRGPVREALKLLRAEGLVNDQPHRGTYVVSLSSSDVREIYDLRAALESWAVRQLAHRRRAGDIAQLRRLLDRLDTALRRCDSRSVAKADMAFHETICRLTGNTLLHAVFVRYMVTLQALFRLDELVYGSLDEIYLQHKSLVEAIAAGDADLGASLLQEHLKHARDLVAGFIDESGDRTNKR